MIVRETEIKVIICLNEIKVQQLRLNYEYTTLNCVDNGNSHLVNDVSLRKAHVIMK